MIGRVRRAARIYRQKGDKQLEKKKREKTYKITQNIISISFFQMDTKKIKKKSKKSKKEKDDITTGTVGEETAVEIRHEPAVTDTCAA